MKGKREDNNVQLHENQPRDGKRVRMKKKKRKKGFILGGYSCNFFHSPSKIGKYCAKFLFK
jgi:hypothetical protein